MQLFKALSVRGKLLGLDGVLVAFMVVSGALGVVNISSTASSRDRLYNGTTVPIDRLEAVETGLGNVDSDLLKAFATRTRAAQYGQAFQTDAAPVERDLNVY